MSDVTEIVLEYHDRFCERIAVRWNGFDQDLCTALQDMPRHSRYWSSEDDAWLVLSSYEGELDVALSPWSHLVTSNIHADGPRTRSTFEEVAMKMQESQERAAVENTYTSDPALREEILNYYRRRLGGYRHPHGLDAFVAQRMDATNSGEEFKLMVDEGIIAITAPAGPELNRDPALDEADRAVVEVVLSMLRNGLEADRYVLSNLLPAEHRPRLDRVLSYLVLFGAVNATNGVFHTVSGQSVSNSREK